MDPEFITSADWREIGNLLHFYWFILLFAIGFGFNFLMAHAIIPSLIGTGHLPEGVSKSRRFFYTGALVSLGLVLFFLLRIAQEAHILRSVWDRWWI